MKLFNTFKNLFSAKSEKKEAEKTTTTKKAECISEYENTGTVEMRAFYAKDDCSHHFYK
jgi:hypothetical protein